MIGERVNAIRTKAGCNLRQFGERVGVSGSAIKNIEAGLNKPSEQTIRSICSEFHVNRVWLESGEGEPYEIVNESIEMAECVLRQMDLDENILIRSMVVTWAQMSADEKSAVTAWYKKLAAQLVGNPDELKERVLQERLDRETAEFRRERELEARAVEKSEHSFEGTEAI